jgi:predicted MFS family arabinose efflux permease
VPAILILLVLAAAAFTDVVTDLLPAGLLAGMSASLHVSGARIGLLVTAFAIASAAAAIPVTVLLRRLPRRPVLAGALAGFAVLDAITAVSPSYPLTFAARLLAGIMGGTLWSLLAGYAASIVPADRRGRALAIVLAGITVALCLGVPAGTAAAAAIGWRGCFAILAGLALALAVVMCLRFPADAADSAADSADAADSASTGGRVPIRRVLPAVAGVLAVTALLLAGHQALYTYIVPFLAWSGFGRASLVLTVFGAATVGGIWIAGLRADQHARSTLLLALIAVMTAMVFLALRAQPLAPVLLWGMAYGAAPTLLQTLLISAGGAANADVATGLQTTVFNLGIAAGSLAGGVVLDQAGAGALPWVTFALSGAALVTLHRAGRRARRPVRSGRSPGGGDGGSSRRPSGRARRWPTGHPGRRRQG